MSTEQLFIFFFAPFDATTVCGVESQAEKEEEKAIEEPMKKKNRDGWCVLPSVAFRPFALEERERDRNGDKFWGKKKFCKDFFFLRGTKKTLDCTLWSAEFKKFSIDLTE